MRCCHTNQRRNEPPWTERGGDVSSPSQELANEDGTNVPCAAQDQHNFPPIIHTELAMLRVANERAEAICIGLTGIPYRTLHRASLKLWTLSIRVGMTRSSVAACKSERDASAPRIAAQQASALSIKTSRLCFFRQIVRWCPAVGKGVCRILGLRAPDLVKSQSHSLTLSVSRAPRP